MVEVLELVLAQIPLRHPGQLVVGEHRRGRLRREDLAAVARGHDPRRAVDAQPVVAGLRDGRLAGVQPHPYAHLAVLGPGVRLQRALPVRCGRRRVAGAGEDVEEGVALGVDLLAAVARERLAHEPLVVGEHCRVAVAQLLGPAASSRPRR